MLISCAANLFFSSAEIKQGTFYFFLPQDPDVNESKIRRMLLQSFMSKHFLPPSPTPLPFHVFALIRGKLRIKTMTGSDGFNRLTMVQTFSFVITGLLSLL
jgi:hypothetical protein